MSDAAPLRVRAGWLLAGDDPAPARGVDVVVAGGRVAGVEPSSGPAGLGGDDAIVLPALADAHDHGRGVASIAFGALDAALETWIPALSLQPWIDPRLLTTAALCRLARSGVASAVHCHNTQRPDDLVDECAAVVAAAGDVGLRVGLAVPLSNRHRLGYGPDEAVLAHVAPAARDAVRAGWSAPPAPVDEQLAWVDAVADAAAGSGGLVQAQYGPVGPQWCSEELLGAVADASARTGRRVHMHLCETRYQREWADAALPQGLLRWLDGLGLLSDRLTVAHAVWLDDADLELLAERRVVVSVNSTSNLRLRSGRARLARMRELGVRFAVGLDGMGLDDDDDALRELQVAHLLHAGTGLDEGPGALDVVRAATRTGPVAVAGDGRWGEVAPGAPADLAVLDGALLADVADGVVDSLDALARVVVARARSRHVTDLVVAGRRVVRDGRVAGVDEAAVVAEVAAACRAGADRIGALAPVVRALQDGLERFYRSGGHVAGGVAAPLAVGGGS